MRSLDCPARIILTAGQRGDAPQAAALLGEDRPDGRLADAAYGANHFREAITKAGAVAIIPNNPSRMKKRPIDRLFGRVIEGYGVDIVLIAIPHGPPSLEVAFKNKDLAECRATGRSAAGSTHAVSNSRSISHRQSLGERPERRQMRGSGGICGAFLP
nr:hypothetical protein [Pararhizobium haloflavum]